MDEKYGSYAFIIGILIAVLAGIGAVGGGLAIMVLVLLGLIVGLLNVTAKETEPFLIAAIALIVAGSANLTIVNSIVSGLGTVLQAILGNIVVFVAPAVIVVALKSVYVLAAKK